MQHQGDTSKKSPCGRLGSQKPTVTQVTMQVYCDALLGSAPWKGPGVGGRGKPLETPQTLRPWDCTSHLSGLGEGWQASFHPFIVAPGRGRDPGGGVPLSRRQF